MRFIFLALIQLWYFLTVDTGFSLGWDPDSVNLDTRIRDPAGGAWQGKVNQPPPMAPPPTPLPTTHTTDKNWKKSILLWLLVTFSKKTVQTY